MFYCPNSNLNNLVENIYLCEIMSQEETSNTIDIRVILKGKIAKEFLAIKDYYGLEARTDFIRFLIHDKYEDLKFKLKEEEKEKL